MFFNRLLFLIFFITQFAFAKVDVSLLKDNLSDQTNKLNKLAAKIKDFDRRIGSNNNSYLRQVKDIENIEHELSELRLESEKSARKISSEFNQVKSALDLYVLEVSENEFDEDIERKSIHFEILKKKITMLKIAEKSSQKNLKKIKNLEESLTSKKSEENEIYSLILELEDQKRKLSQTYVDELESKNQLQSQIEKMAAREKAKKVIISKANTKIDFDFNLPISDFVDAEKKKGGINIKYSETVPINAPGSGKVAYVGELASYGKVIILDHGKDVRSVLFGDIVTKVEKNKIVQKGQIIGYTMGEPGTVKSVYYEVRKKNKVQNTVMWLHPNHRKSVKI